MSWRCSSSSNAGLIDSLLTNGVISNEEVADALREVDRKLYLPEQEASSAYADQPVPIGYSATLSAPHMHAMCLEHALEHVQDRKSVKSVLDVGSGSGYLVSAFAHLFPRARVVGVEHIQALCDFSLANLRRDHCLDHVENGPRPTRERIQVLCADGRLGYGDNAPYQVIHVGAAAKEIPPKLLEQLDVGGIMLIPVGGENEGQELLQITKDANGELTEKKLMGVRYVPLTDADAHLS